MRRISLPVGLLVDDTFRSCSGCPWLRKPGRWWACTHPGTLAQAPPGLPHVTGRYLGTLALTPGWCPLSRRVGLIGGGEQTSAPGPGQDKLG